MFAHNTPSFPSAWTALLQGKFDSTAKELSKREAQLSALQAKHDALIKEHSKVTILKPEHMKLGMRGTVLNGFLVEPKVEQSCVRL